jgi:hypothetical protein
VALLCVIGAADGAAPSAAAPSAAPAAAAAPSAADAIDCEVTCLTENVSAGLPVVLRLSWRNTSRKPVELHAEAPRAVTFETTLTTQSRRLMLPVTSLGTITLEPGKAVTSTFLVVAGRPEAKPEAPLEAIFSAAGTYKINIDGFPTDGPLVVTVTEPTDRADRDALKNWTPAMTACLAGESAKIKDASLEQHVWQVLVLQEKGPYAGYALWAKAKGFAQIAANHPEDDANVNTSRRDVAMKACQAILEGHPETPVQELALEMQVDLAQALGLGTEARQSAQKLVEKYPTGLALARLRQAYGKDFEKLATAEAPPAAPAAPYVLPPMGPADAARQLVRDLRNQFVNWHITDGQQDRVPYEDVKKQAAAGGKVADSKTIWMQHTAVMMSDRENQLLLTGQIHLVIGEGAAAKAVDRRVRIMLAPDGKGGMILKDVKVTDDPPVPPPGGSQPPTVAPTTAPTTAPTPRG